MKLVEHKESDGKVRKYKVSPEGTYFNEGTPDEVITLLELARKLNYFVWFRLGDKETGRDWMEENYVCGFVGRSTGPVKIPILLATRRSTGGGGILTDSIVRLVVHGGGRNRRWLWANYQAPDLVIEHDPNGKTPVAVLVRNRHEGLSIQARFPNRVKAQRWADFITGGRLNK